MSCSGPGLPTAGELITISFDAAGGPLAAASEVFAHVGFDDWSTVNSPDAQMTWNPVGRNMEPRRHHPVERLTA